jgi:hypothetical protein
MSERLTPLNTGERMTIEDLLGPNPGVAKPGEPTFPYRMDMAVATEKPLPEILNHLWFNDGDLQGVIRDEAELKALVEWHWPDKPEGVAEVLANLPLQQNFTYYLTTWTEDATDMDGSWMPGRIHYIFTP